MNFFFLGRYFKLCLIGFKEFKSRHKETRAGGTFLLIGKHIVAKVGIPSSSEGPGADHGQRGASVRMT